MQRFLISLVLLSYILSKAPNYSTNLGEIAFEKNHQQKNLDLLDTVSADDDVLKAGQSISDVKDDKLNKNSKTDTKSDSKSDRKIEKTKEKTSEDKSDIVNDFSIKVTKDLINDAKTLRTLKNASEIKKLNIKMRKEAESLRKIMMKKNQTVIDIKKVKTSKDKTKEKTSKDKNEITSDFSDKVGKDLVNDAKTLRTLKNATEIKKLKIKMRKEAESLRKITMKKNQENIDKKKQIKTLQKNMDSEKEKQAIIQKKKLKEDKVLEDSERIKKQAYLGINDKVKRRVINGNNVKIDNMYPDSSLHNQNYKSYKEKEKFFEKTYNDYSALVFKSSKVIYKQKKKLGIIRARIIKAQLSKNRNLIDMLGVKRLTIYLQIADYAYKTDKQTLQSILINKKRQTLVKFYYQDILEKCTKNTTDVKNLPATEKTLKDVRQKISDLNKKYNTVIGAEQTKVKDELQNSSTKRDKLLKDISQTKNLEEKCTESVPKSKLEVKFADQLLEKTNESIKYYVSTVISQKLAHINFVNLINLKRRMDIQSVVSDIYVKRIIRYETNITKMDSELKEKFIKKLSLKDDLKHYADESDRSTDYKNDVEFLLGKGDDKIAKNKKQFFFPQSHVNDDKSEVDFFQKDLAYEISKIPHPFTKLVFVYKKELDRKLLVKIQELNSKVYTNYVALEGKALEMWKYSTLFKQMDGKVLKYQLKSLKTKKIALTKFIEFFKFENANPITEKKPKRIALNKKMMKDTAIEIKNISVAINMKTNQEKIRNLQIERQFQRVRYMTNTNLAKIMKIKKTTKINLYETAKKRIKQDRNEVLGKIAKLEKRYVIDMPKEITGEIVQLNKEVAVCKQSIEHMDKDKATAIALYDKAIATLKARTEELKVKENDIFQKGKVINKELNSYGLFKVSLPVLMGLQVPEGITCQNENQIYLECYHNDWKVSGDETRFYCQLWGKNRGQCSHVKENGRVIDITKLTLPIKQNSICTNNNMNVRCVNYKSYTLTTCPVSVKKDDGTCPIKYIAKPYNPNTFPNCTIESLERICENKYETQKRICTFQNTVYYECKTYKKQPCDSKCQKTNRKRLQQNKPKLPSKYSILYESYMRQVTAEYDVIALSKHEVKKDDGLNEDYDV